MSKCGFKHAVPQVPDKHWRCPSCGSKSHCKDPDDPSRETDGWIIDDPICCDCEELHEQDILNCYICDASMTGAEYAEWYAKKAKMVKCPHCKGTGLVKKGKR